ncbi:AAA-associated domain-containing protein [Actinacidiphila oryziradicis]|uniref:AAA-associated domain-containing protein n=1 Tax=Actinacidiphila oryziradicis TaxID=2571141 RepID=UPI001FEB6D7B|nr:AAA-associated domain-containing protein [Actinacidiphila oryziradicis]
MRQRHVRSERPQEAATALAAARPSPSNAPSTWRRGRSSSPSPGSSALDLLRRGFSAADARRQLEIAVDWGRYGELFEYDADDGQLILEPPTRALLQPPAPTADSGS